MRTNFRLLVLSLSLAGFWAGPGNRLLAEDPVFQAIDSSVQDLSRLTGLKLRRKIERDTITKDKLRAFLEDQIKREIEPEQIRIEELSLKKLGLVPADFNLAKTTVELMTEQAAAFYDYRRKKLFLLEGTGGIEQETVLVHELAHALADQHFNLGSYLKRGKTDDSSLARMAVMEGQATWLMFEIQAGRMGMSLKNSPALVEMMSRGSTMASSQFPVLAGSPLYMRASLLFPYMAGLKFQQAVIEKHGTDAFRLVFDNPPRNTQQILHPELYLDAASVREPELPEINGQRQYKTLNAGTIGEFDHSVLIEQYVNRDEGQALSPHWRSGAFRLLEDKKTGRVVLLYRSEWDSPDHTQRMYMAYRQILRGKNKRFRVMRESDTLLLGEGDDGYFRLERVGNQITSIEGMSDGEMREGDTSKNVRFVR
jgi:hypothetical protein